MGEATLLISAIQDYFTISIHASRGGSDDFLCGYIVFALKFQSTLPVGEATNLQTTSRLPQAISIHASRGGSDHRIPRAKALCCDFNPRFPWGKRHKLSKYMYESFDFNPRFPWGKRRSVAGTRVRVRNISIHASRGGSDGDNSPNVSGSGNFNPRFPWGKRRRSWYSSARTWTFQSTLPVGEATQRCI